MISTSPPVVIILTPPGRGAVATVLVTGEQAVEMVGGLFRPASDRPLGEFAHGRIVFGLWGGSPGEELVVCRRGDDEIEIHCHGGTAAVQAIVGSLQSAGCKLDRWQNWCRRRAASPVRADAFEDLARATTVRTAAILLDQYHGALDAEMEAIIALLSSGELPERNAAERLHALLARARLGLHLVEPFHVVLAGRPNAGKSSLINALLGYQRSIVHDQPGTTRDVVTAGTAFDGWPVELADTAGLRESGDPLEAAGIGLAEQRLLTADLQVLVFDASQAWTDADRRLCQRWPEALVVHSKSDLPRGDDRPPGIFTSAATGEGVESLARSIAYRLAPDLPPTGAAVPFRPNHVQAVSHAAAACARGDRNGAIRAIGEILAISIPV